MDKIEPIEIPQSHIDFANEVAKLAENHGMREFSLKYKPDWSSGDSWDNRVYGDATIQFSSKDGRGRPCRNVSINLTAHCNHTLESNPESSN